MASHTFEPAVVGGMGSNQVTLGILESGKGLGNGVNIGTTVNPVRVENVGCCRSGGGMYLDGEISITWVFSEQGYLP